MCKGIKFFGWLGALRQSEHVIESEGYSALKLQGILSEFEIRWFSGWRWLLLLLKCPGGGFALDPDSTVFCREGQQEGARKGFHPRRKGRHSHHPLRAVLAEAPFILHGWLRSGNTGAARGVVPFLQEALALLPAGTWLRTVRADRGFFAGGFLDFLEERALPYGVVARLTSTLKRKCAGIQNWTVIDEHPAAGEFTVKLFGWSKERRLAVVREQIRETKAAVGRKLLDVPGYTFRVWVTNRSEAALELWRDDNGRACVEQRNPGVEARSGRRRVLPAAVLCDGVRVSRRAVRLQPAEPVSAPDHAGRAVSAAGDVAGGGVPVRCGAGGAGP